MFSILDKKRSKALDNTGSKKLSLLLIQPMKSNYIKAFEKSLTKIGNGQLTHLKKLYLNNNQITKIPPEIGQLTHLEILYISSNQILNFHPKRGLKVYKLSN